MTKLSFLLFSHLTNKHNWYCVLFLPSCSDFSQVPVESEVAKHASLYHQVALVLLSWLLPGSEYLAHELLSTIIFSKDFIS